MTKRQSPENKKKKPLDRDDMELWSKVAATVEPLKGSSSYLAMSQVIDSQQDGAQPARSKPVKSAPVERTKPPVQRPPAPVRNHTPPLTGLDRRTSQKLARGNTTIDATLDLHGMGKESARTALKNFLLVSRASGRRTVLVITGKGRSPYSSHTLHGYQQVDTPEREGVIRKAFPGWIDEPEMRAHVAGYQPAHPRHGGGGAFYVRLRKQRD